MLTQLNCLKQLNTVFTRTIQRQEPFLTKLIRGSQLYLSLKQRKLMISVNNQLSNQITSFRGVSQSSLLSPILFILYVSSIPQSVDAQVYLSHSVKVISIWAQTQAIRSINLSLKNHLNQILTWFDRWRIKMNPGKTYLTNFSQRKIIYL